MSKKGKKGKPEFVLARSMNENEPEVRQIKYQICQASTVSIAELQPYAQLDWDEFKNSHCTNLHMLTVPRLENAAKRIENLLIAYAVDSVEAVQPLATVAELDEQYNYLLKRKVFQIGRRLTTA